MKTNMIKILTTAVILSNCTLGNSFLADLKVSEVTAQDVVLEETSDINLLDDVLLMDLVNSAYNSVDLINKALEERLEYQFAERIEFLHEKSKQITLESEEDTEELLLRLTLQRTNKVGQEIVNIMGQNNEEGLRWLANFYKDGFELAANMVNANYMLLTELGELGDYDKSKRYLTSAEYGRRHALRMWEYTSGLQSDAAKGVLLARLVSFLGTDLKNDLRRRGSGIAKSLADVYHLQNSQAYKNVVSSIQGGMIPERVDLAKLRRSIYTLITEMNTRF